MCVALFRERRKSDERRLGRRVTVQQRLATALQALRAIGVMRAENERNTPPRCLRSASPHLASPRRAASDRVKRAASGRTKRQVTSRQTGRRAMRVVATVSAGLGRARQRSVASAAVVVGRAVYP